MKDILIVEPSKELSLILAQALIRKELSVSIAHSAQEAILAADESTPRLIILELLMPRHNGLEFIHELRSYAEWLEIPIIVYSGISSEEFAITDKLKNELGIIEHFYKPSCSLSRLVESVEEVLVGSNVTK